MTISKERRQWDYEEVEFLPIDGIEQPILRFQHKYHGVNEAVRVNKKILGHRDATDHVLFTIKSIKEELLGFIEGFWIYQDGKILFEANTSRNNQRCINEFRDHEEQNVPIPRVVGATIAEIIKQGIVDIWYSSYTLVSSGRRMYGEFLAQNPDLRVTPYDFEDGQGYVVIGRR